MAVPEQLPIVSYVANGATDHFNITFDLSDERFLVVTVNNEIPPVGTFTVQDNDVIFHTIPEAGTIITLARDTNLERETTYSRYDNSFNPAALNWDLDKLWHVLQEQNLVDAKILARIKSEIEWRRTHDFNYDELAKVREQQLFDALKGYTDTSLASINPGVFQGVVAGVVFARDGKSIQTHLEEILETLVQDRENISLKAARTYVDEQLLIKQQQIDLKASKVTTDNLQLVKAEKSYVDNALAGFTNGTFKAYPTLAAANADIANIALNTRVSVLSSTEGGDYYKASAGATSLTKSPWDPVQQAKDYSDQKIKTFSIYKNIEAYVETVLDINGFTRVKMQSKGGQTYFYDSRIAENDQSIKELSATVKGVEIYKKIKGTVTTVIDANGFTRIKEQNVTTGQFISYIGAKQKPLVAGAGISILETAETITIEAGSTAYATPYEYILCLVIGQSNNTTEGGNEAEAPSLPPNICLIWNNTYSTLSDINTSEQKASVVPAMALEFYRQTGLGLIVVNSAVGASAMSELASGTAGRSWDVAGTLRQPAIDRLNACKSYLNSNGYCYQMGFISWSQGEQDGVQIQNGVITINDYKAAFTTFIDFIKTNVGTKVPFIITRTGYRTADNSAYKSIRDAQMEFAHTMPTVYMGYTGTLKFFNRDMMHDSVHYNQRGKNIVGTAIGKIASKLSAGVN